MRIIVKAGKAIIAILILLSIVFFVGPKVNQPNLDTTLPQVESDLLVLEQWIQEREKSTPNIKKDNEARIVWFDSVPKKTVYSIVYLHGWSASQGEGSPLHVNTAKQFGCNLYLPRLAGHGLEEKEPMLNLTADALIESAKEAIAVGKKIGEKVILMATSTGGTLALHLAQEDSDIAAILLYSPNVEIYDQNAKLLAGPWGVQLAKAVKQSDYHEFEADAERKKYWTHKYRVEALTHLQVLVDNTMVPETFAKITQPVFMGYFYKNDSIQDEVVSVPAMLAMFEQLGTPSGQKRKVAFPESANHVMTSYITSKDLASVREETFKYLKEVLELQPINDPIVEHIGY